MMDLCICRFDDSADQMKQDTLTYLHNTTRVLLLLIQKCDVTEIFVDVSIKFVSACFYVVENDFIPYDTKSNCGLLLVYACNHLPLEAIEGFVSITSSMMLHLKLNLSFFYNLLPHLFVCSSPLLKHKSL